MNEQIQVELKGHILAITMVRPEKKNALTVAMYNSLADAFDRADADAQVRVVHITGCDTSFSSGNDLKDFLADDHPPMDVPPMDVPPPVRLLHSLNRCSKPIVAAVNGLAIGIGTTMLLHCDLVYLARSARLQMPFVDLGVVPEGASSALLPMMLGHCRAAELLIACEPMDAQQAVDLGFGNRVCDESELQEFSWQKAEALAAKPAAAVQLTKAMLKANRSKPVAQAIDDEFVIFEQRLQSPEAKEAMSAIMERRKPDFSQC